MLHAWKAALVANSQCRVFSQPNWVSLCLLAPTLTVNSSLFFLFDSGLPCLCLLMGLPRAFRCSVTGFASSCISGFDSRLYSWFNLQFLYFDSMKCDYLFELIWVSWYFCCCVGDLYSCLWTVIFIYEKCFLVFEVWGVLVIWICTFFSVSDGDFAVYHNVICKKVYLQAIDRTEPSLPIAHLWLQ